jgi:hypothetical protein
VGKDGGSELLGGVQCLGRIHRKVLSEDPADEQVSAAGIATEGKTCKRVELRDRDTGLQLHGQAERVGHPSERRSGLGQGGQGR